MPANTPPPARPPENLGENVPHAAKPPSSSAAAADTARPVTKAPGVGNILRAAYQSMVEENIPDEMLNLLNRLD